MNKHTSQTWTFFAEGYVPSCLQSTTGRVSPCLACWWLRRGRSCSNERWMLVWPRPALSSCQHACQPAHRDTGWERILCVLYWLARLQLRLVSERWHSSALADKQLNETQHPCRPMAGVFLQQLVLLSATVASLTQPWVRKLKNLTI